MIDDKYYFTKIMKYPTLWHGFLAYKRINNEAIPWLDLDNILIDICDINFYISKDDNNIYLSVDRDECYYVNQFEKHIKKVIKEIEIKLQIKIESGEFNANEVKHNGSQFKYTICKNNDKIILKKIVLNWNLLNKNRDDDEDVSDKISKLNI